MTLKETLFADFITAMKNKDSITKNILWIIKTKITLIEKEKWEVSNDDVINLIQKEVKSLDSTINFEWIKVELKEQAEIERKILEKYLPAKLTKDEVVAEIMNAINSWIINKDIWSIMRFSKEKFTWKFDFKELSEIAKELNT